MKLHRIFQLVLQLSLVAMSLTGCNQILATSPLLQEKPRPTFQSDEQLKTNFQKRKADMFTLMKKCQVEQKSQALKRDIRQPFSTCEADETLLKSISVKEIAEEFRRTQPLPSDFKGGRVLFVTDYYKNDPADTFVEEKGYMYSPTPLRQDVIENGTLDQFTGQLLFEKRSRQEAWRYKQIAPNWYLYYRQYYYPYLG
jgi:hypothetical protein